MVLSDLISCCKIKPALFRIKIKGEAPGAAWSKWIIQPSESYIETEKDGPVSLSNIEWLDLNPIQTITGGKYTLEKKIDHGQAFADILQQKNIAFQITTTGLRILL